MANNITNLDSLIVGSKSPMKDLSMNKLLMLKKLVGGGEKTLSGSVVSFIGKSSTEILGLTADITPVQSGSGDPSPDNVRPITGYTGANIYRDGGNIFDVSTCTPGYYISETGSIGALSYAMYSDLIPVEAGDDYVFSYTLLRSSSRTRIHGYDSSENWVSQLATAPNEVGEITVSLTIPAGISFVRISTTSAFGTDNPRGEDYKFRRRNIYTVDWTSAAGTVYGGTLDVLTGKLTVDRAYITVGDKTWSVNNGCFRTSGVSTGKAEVIACSDYKIVSDSISPEDRDDYSINCGNTGGNNTRIYIKDTSFNGDADAFKTAMASCQIVFNLATPLEYNLTPQTVSALVGQNYVWADTGDVTVKVKNASVL